MRFILHIAALVVFILAIIAGFGNLDWRWEGLVSTALALWCAAGLVPDTWVVPRR